MKPRILLILIVLGFYNASYAVLTTPTQLAPTVDADTVSAWSSTFTFTTDVLSGLNNQFNENGAVYFSNEQLNIKLNKNLIGATCQIINAAGQIIYEEILWDLNSQIFASQWSKGIYFVRIVQHEKQQSFKIVVQ